MDCGGDEHDVLVMPTLPHPSLSLGVGGDLGQDFCFNFDIGPAETSAVPRIANCYWHISLINSANQVWLCVIICLRAF